MTENIAEAAETLLVRVHRDRALLRITLNRPRALNALNHDMVRTLSRILADERRLLDAGESTAQVILLDGAGERGFCGGGDVKELTSSPPDAQLKFLEHEYHLDAALAAAPLPVVSVMHGVTMGGGIGLGGHVAFRVVTETAKLGMPEVRIGILPDVGGLRLLAHAPGWLGELLAMTAGTMTAGDAVALGFADAVVPGERIATLRELLASGEDAQQAVAQCAQHAPESRLLHSRAWWEGLAEAALGDPEQVAAQPASAVRRLLAAMEESPHHEARDAAVVARQMSPMSVAVSVAQLSQIRVAELDLRAVLADDFRLMGRLMARPDFREGVRAQLIDRDGAPQWQPAHLDQVSDAEVRELLRRDLAPGERPLWA